jgi:hypothetical protein
MITPKGAAKGLPASSVGSNGRKVARLLQVRGPGLPPN